MVRITSVVIALLLGVGFIVALLPAQEQAAAEPGRFVPASSVYDAAPVAGEATDSATPDSESTPDDIGPIPASEVLGAPAELPSDETSGLRSVLKRPRPMPEETPAGESGTSADTAASEEADAAETAQPMSTPAPILHLPRALVPARPQEAEAPTQPEEISPEEPATLGSSNSGATGSSGSARRGKPAAEKGSRTKSPKPTASAAAPQQIQIASRYPNLQVQLVGPSAIQVGKAGKYVLDVTNDGESTAQDVAVRVTLPTWVSVAKAEATGGEAEVQADAMGTPRLVWSLPTIAPGAHQQLQIQLIAAEGQPFDLNVEWACRPVSAQARVTVKQPQLDLSLAGPADMLFGEEKMFTLTVSNPGTGDATGVAVLLSSGANRPKEVEVGTIPAGEQVEIPLQVVANQAGTLELRAAAAGDGGLKADATGKVLVRQAQLAVSVEAPELKFAGSETSYVVTVANAGNAAADEVHMAIVIPAGAKYVGGVSGASVAGGKLQWKAGTIAAGSEKQFEVRCQLLAEGANRLVAQVVNKAGLKASGEAVTTVEAISDLKLVVNDPAGPTPVGQEVVYEVQVMNRGTRAATQVKIVMQFGAGIEPTEMVGGQGKIVPGQVVCEPLPELAAGEQVTLRIKAKAEKTGTHQFRVEVTSGDGDARLVSEGTSRFFTDRASAAARTAKKPVSAPAAEGTIQR